MLQWKSNKEYIFRECVCGLTYAISNAHAPYFYLRPLCLTLYDIFSHCLINVKTLEKKKKLLDLQYVFQFSLHWGDLGVDGWIILGWISGRWEVGIWTGLGWPRIETVGGSL